MPVVAVHAAGAGVDRRAAIDRGRAAGVDGEICVETAVAEVVRDRSYKAEILACFAVPAGAGNVADKEPRPRRAGEGFAYAYVRELRGQLLGVGLQLLLRHAVRGLDVLCLVRSERPVREGLHSEQYRRQLRAIGILAGDADLRIGGVRGFFRLPTHDVSPAVELIDAVLLIIGDEPRITNDDPAVRQFDHLPGRKKLKNLLQALLERIVRLEDPGVAVIRRADNKVRDAGKSEYPLDDLLTGAGKADVVIKGLLRETVADGIAPGHRKCRAVRVEVDVVEVKDAHRIGGAVAHGKGERQFRAGLKKRAVCEDHVLARIFQRQRRLDDLAVVAQLLRA